MFLAAPATAQSGSLATALSPFISMLFIFGIFWALVIRPQQQKDKERREMLRKLKKGDRVIMSSGIHGEITDVKDDLLTVKIAEKVEIRVARSGIAQLRK